MGSKVHDDEVRRKYQDFLASAGISENRVATEVLYWLPHEDDCAQCECSRDNV